MSPEKSSSTMKVCPTCGTRLSENATRCLVCGRNFTVTSKPSQESPVESPRLPELKLSLPAALGLIFLVLAVGAGIVYLILQGTDRIAAPTPDATMTETPTMTASPQPSSEPTLAPTYTPLPPIDYVVKENDQCVLLAAINDVSLQSIIDANGLTNECILSVGQTIKIPQPTPTATTQPTSTQSSSQSTTEACQTLDYTVGAGDTFSSIAANYNIAIDSIKSYNNTTSDVVWEGMQLKLPLCMRLPTEGPTPTPTTPPAYAAPSLLLPVDGIVYANTTDVITLQWSSVGTLRENEVYMVTIEDVTSSGVNRVVQYVTDTKLTVPVSLRPSDSTSHIFRWWVVAARQAGSNADGTPIYETNGALSTARVFGWAGTSSATVAP
jgi:LysM repeat protein